MPRAAGQRALVARPQERLLVDGTNVAWAWAPVRALLIAQAFGAAQQLLVDRLATSGVAGTGGDCTVVFDGPPPPGGPASRGAVRVRYPEPGQSGDDRLLQLVAATAHTDVRVRLVTSDRALGDAARRLGATTSGGGTLLDRLDPAWRSTGIPRRAGAAAPTEAGDRKPHPTRADTERWLERFGAPDGRRRGGGGRPEPNR
ncbi:MAG TPA: NYN domain-containing protein [Candidatus Micrarchaeia archaeon]|nr:NYN domain-containing protein [Candidatus Micrarchaeia archaeon]